MKLKRIFRNFFKEEINRKVESAIRMPYEPKYYEPKYSNRFIVYWSGPFSGIPTWAVKATNRPKWVDSNWDDLIFELYDTIATGTSSEIMKGLNAIQNKDSDIIKVSMHLLDPIGSTVETWDITGRIKEVDFGILDYGINEPINIVIVLEVSTAVLKSK